MLVTKDDLYDGLEFKIGTDKYKIVNYTKLEYHIGCCYLHLQLAVNVLPLCVVAD